MRESTNPVFRKVSDHAETYTDAATYTGITAKTGIFLLVAFAAAFGANLLLKDAKFDALISIFIAATIAAFIAVLIGTLVPRVSAPFGALYSASQGFVLGTLTILLDQIFPGIGIMAITGTLVIFGVTLLLYTSGKVRASNKMRKFVLISLIGLILMSFTNWILSLIFPEVMTIIQTNLPLAIIVSLFIIFLGAIMLILDFDRAQQLVQMGAPKNYEWTVALGLMVTIVWIYLEVLKLLVILLSRRD